MMNQTLRLFFAALCTVALIVAGGASTSFADSSHSYEAALPVENSTSPVVLDVLLLRPAGILVFLSGSALFVPAALYTLVTRPTEIAKPFEALVVAPARYVWVDGLGEH